MDDALMAEATLIAAHASAAVAIVDIGRHSKAVSKGSRFSDESRNRKE
jgi:hypothetical protein